MEYSKQVKPKYSKVLREFRQKNNYTQTTVAKALGVRQKTISDWENGKSSARDFLAGVRFAMLALKEGMELEDLIMSYPDQTTEHE
ncbi:helix-turn-helix transcriptional regulator [Synechocystis sp. LEGE 06083]|uniref:helix-turn-helix domain-containing protein n=1 Tax=Synechocystis sp. LEGE 06083 TaxID=915336 RepID=UPI00188027A5|nr:helix-turn-helix transcriptional regulator [Synechocystis sp. LEGE 06083]MBE9193874.1 helix-turn-helix transcriptional regulator [Synechocystis sp. LEGE 06083]